MEMVSYPFDSNEILLNKKSILRRLREQDGLIPKRIAVLSGSTIGDIPDVLEIFLLHYGIRPAFYTGQYNRFYEDIMFDNRELCDFKPELIIIHTTARNLSDGEFINKMQAVWSKIKGDFSCAVIQNNLELPVYGFEPGQIDVDFANRQIAEYAEQNSNFYINDICALSARYGLDKWYDEHNYYLYKYAFSVNAIPAYCHNLAKIIKSIYGKNQKCLVLDLDNTLWGGVIGEVGTNGIELGLGTAQGEAYFAFQKYVKVLHDRGVILAVCSKNDENTAKEAFGNPNMVLSVDDFAVFVANWESKAENILSIAERLNILPESIVFVDDNPAERELVKQTIADVKVVEEDSVVNFIRYIEGAGYFYAAKISQDDVKRNEYYAADAKRNEAKNAYMDYGEYLDSLQMTSEIHPFISEHLERITQLINKTNQFNLTTKRYNFGEVERIAEDEGYITLYATLNDKFGSNGIVSALIGEIDDKSLHIRLWVMSCRVFKRELELAVFDRLVYHCRCRGINKVIGYYYKTGKNGFVAGLYNDLGFKQVSDEQWELMPVNNYREMNKHIKIKT